MVFSSLIHFDILRHIIDAAAIKDRRTALKLAVLSRITQRWVEPIIYTEVILRHENSGRAFIHTLRTSKTKPPSFFAQHVKSLVINSDIEAQLVAEILSVCRGIINFSYWATPNLSIRRPSSPRVFYKRDGPLVAPRKMSVILHENYNYPLKPHFNLVFYSCVTHLSILNSWEEWTTWTRICSDAMPALTHIKFDLNSRASCPNTMEIQNPELGFIKKDWGEVSMTPESSWLDIKLSRVANTLSEVLKHIRTLRVCILLLRFDTNPTYTAKVIAQKFHQSGRVQNSGFDSRLVFAHEREPFRYSHAHSNHEMMVWKSAETIVDSQRYITGYTLLDCTG